MNHSLQGKCTKEKLLETHRIKKGIAPVKAMGCHQYVYPTPFVRQDRGPWRTDRCYFQEVPNAHHNYDCLGRLELCYQTTHYCQA